MATKSLCSIPDCGNTVKVIAKQLCSMHYQRMMKFGDPLAGRNYTSRGEQQTFFRETVIPYEGDECLIWPYSRTNGYGVMKKGERMCVVSRVLCEEVNGPPPSIEYDAAHSCGRGKQGCVTKGHLSWKTKADNCADKLIHGTHNRGERSAHAKLTEAQAIEIISLKGKKKQSEIAAFFGISHQTVSKIHRGERWGWL